MSMWMTNPNAYGPAAGPIFQELYKQPAAFAGVLGNNYGSYAGGLASTGKSFADAFGAYGAGMGSIAQARANENSARFGANAMAEAARQAGVANIGAASLGAFGSASNSALNAWAANQQAYNRAAADMHTANAQGMSNYGVSRNNALGAMSGAYGDIGRAQVGANALSNLNFSMGDGGGFGGGSGFSATGPGGPIASGSFGGGGGGGGMNFSGSSSRSSSGMGGGQALAGLGGLRDAVTSSDIPDRLDRLGAAGRKQLDDQHYSSRGMPSQMLGQTLSGLMTLGAPAYGSSAAGMNQFYANTQPNERAYESMLGQLGGGFNQVGRQIGGVQHDLGRGFNTANQGVRGMWDASLGRLPEFMTPAQREVARREGEIEADRSAAMRRMRELTRLMNSSSGADTVDGKFQRAHRANMQHQMNILDQYDNPTIPSMPTYTSAADRVRRSLGAF